MILRLEGKAAENLRIENLRDYPGELVEKLRGLLLRGAEARPDPSRKGFYDVDNGARVFFIHVSPVSGKVMLLASWRKQQAAEPASLRAGSSVASSQCLAYRAA